MGDGTGYKTWGYCNVLESDQDIGAKSIYWMLTICRMTGNKRVKSEKERKVSKVQFLYPLVGGAFFRYIIDQMTIY